jgi:hypothetical protein
MTHAANVDTIDRHGSLTTSRVLASFGTRNEPGEVGIVIGDKYYGITEFDTE